MPIKNATIIASLGLLVSIVACDDGEDADRQFALEAPARGDAPRQLTDDPEEEIESESESESHGFDSLTHEEKVLEIIDNLVQAGCPDSEIEIKDDGRVFVGGDVYVTLDASREMIGHGHDDISDGIYGDVEDLSGPVSPQSYSCNGWVAAGYTDICICAWCLCGKSCPREKKTCCISGSSYCWTEYRTLESDCIYW